MKNIKEVNLRKGDNIEENDKFWCFGKRLLEIKASYYGKRVIRVNDNCGLIPWFLSRIRVIAWLED